MSLSKVIKLPSLLQKLEEGGYDTLDQVKKECLSSLAKELELNKEEVKAVSKFGAKGDSADKKQIHGSLAMEIESSFTTAVRNFDRMLVYGISPKKITEICGESGTGKTQLCMQMAVTIQLSKSQGGSEGECVYIDTEGSFNPSRIQKIAERLDLKDPLKGIHVFRILNYTEFVAIIMQLTEILTNRTKVKLIIIDSMAYHLRVNTLTFRGRIDFLNFAGYHLIKIAKDLTVSIVVTNHVTTDGTSGTWTPSLGNEWGNWCANRLFLFRKREFRFGHLFKSVEEIEREDSMQFCIKDKGVFDPDNDQVLVAFKNENAEQLLSSQDRFGSLLQGDELEILALEKELEKIKKQENVCGKRSLEDAGEMRSYIDDYLNEHCTKSTRYDDQIHISSQLATDDPINVNSRPMNDPMPSSFQQIPNVNNSSTIPGSDHDDDIDDNEIKNDKMSEEPNFWASDGEEERDLDFLANIQSYF